MKEDYEFSNEWHNVLTNESWGERLSEFKNKEHVRYLELGVYEGASLMWVFSNLLTHETSSAVVVDYFSDKTVEARFFKNLERSGQSHRTQVIRGSTEEALATFAACSFDIIYIDADHAAKGVIADATMAWRALKNNGVMIFDDYLWGQGEYPNYLRPGPAIDFFIEAYKQDCHVLWKNIQVAIRKKEWPKSTSMVTKIGKYHYYWLDRRLTFCGREVALSDTGKDAIRLYLLREQNCKEVELEKIVSSFACDSTGMSKLLL